MSRRLGIAILLFAPLLSVVSCRLPGFQSSIRVMPLRPLIGAEITVGSGTPAESVWVTSVREIRLRYSGDPDEFPVAVVFYYRSEGQSSWSKGPLWKPGEAEPAWKPPAEGRWEFVAVPYSDFTVQRISAPADCPPQNVVSFDWSSPRLQVDTKIPRDAFAGGARLPLGWRVFEDHLLAGSVHLEMSEAADAPWQTVTTLPDHGRWVWTLPNRALAGARLRIVAVDAAGNRGEALIPGVLAVTGVEPLARLEERQLRAAAETQQIGFEYDLPGGGELARSELWISDDNGATWRLGGYDLDGAPFDADLDEGDWGIWIVVEDDQGNRSRYPAPGDRPRARLVVDWTAPVVAWDGSRLEANGENSLEGMPLRDVLAAYTIAEHNLDLESLRFDLKRGEQPWRTMSMELAAAGEVRFPLQEGRRGPTLIRLRGRDFCGNNFVAEQTLYTADLIDPPQLTFQDPPQGWHTGGSELVFAYESSWSTAIDNPVDLNYSFDGVVWRPLASGLPAKGSFTWKLPEISEDGVRVRMTLRSHDGRTLHKLTPGFSIDSIAPIARVVGPHDGFSGTIQVVVEASDQGGSGLKGLQLFSRRKSVTRWLHSGSFPPDSRHVTFTPPEAGEYELWLLATDHAGNNGVSPSEAQASELFALNVRTGVPKVQLVSFQDGGVYAGGSRHLVFVSWPEGESIAGIAELQLSTDDGGTWQPVGRFSLSHDHHPWVLPNKTIASCRLRVVTQEVSGRRTVDQTKLPFRIDASAPTVQVQKVTRSAAGPARLHCNATDTGGAGLHRLWVYYTQDEGDNWHRWGEPFPADESVELDLGPGDYGFVVVGEDRVGNIGNAPLAGRRPAVVHNVAATGGVELALLNPTGGTLAGGTRHYVFWRLDPAGTDFPERPVALYSRLEGGEWELIKRHLPAVGREPWYVPEEEGMSLDLRVVATALNGSQFVAVSEEPIRIDSSMPEVMLATGTRVTSTGRPTEVKYRLAQPERLREVELWTRALSTPKWRHVATANVGTPLHADIADGMYRIALVAIDEAGNRSPSPAPGDPGHGDLLVDTQAPMLVVEQVGERKNVFHEGDWCVLRARVQDRHLSAFPVTFRISADGGEKFEMLKRYHPNGDEFPVPLPSHVGPMIIEVTAEDLAGNRTRELVHVQVIPRTPEVRLLTQPAGAILRAGSEMRIEWESRGVNPLAAAVSVAFTGDGKNWTTLAAGLKADGHYVWRVPEVDSNRCQLRLTVLRPDGISSAAESGRFTISSTAPDVKVEGVVPKGG